jgi:hypothetical protein
MDTLVDQQFSADPSPSLSSTAIQRAATSFPAFLLLTSLTQRWINENSMQYGLLAASVGAGTRMLYLASGEGARSATYGQAQRVPALGGIWVLYILSFLLRLRIFGDYQGGDVSIYAFRSIYIFMAW